MNDYQWLGVAVLGFVGLGLLALIMGRLLAGASEHYEPVFDRDHPDPEDMGA